MIGSVVDEVLKEIGNAANEGMKTADDYMDTETGLLMCGRCHTKKQNSLHSFRQSKAEQKFNIVAIKQGNN